MRCLQHKDSKEAMMKMIDESSELGQHIKKAWETQEQEETEKEGFMVSIMGVVQVK